VSFFDNLKTIIQTHSLREVAMSSSAELPYTNKLRIIQEFLQRPEPPKRSEVVQKLGNGTKALESVPTALYCFLLAAHHENLPELTVKITNPVLRSIFYAISLGGDTDTIASMSGAISGAYWGNMGIPNEIVQVCEGYKDILNMADSLYNKCISVS
jgi:poly(ADP-ribose) glycohydrolase ARH3